jgi:hypothetical protein
MVEIKFAGVEIRHILEPIHKDKGRNYANNTFVGNPSSNSIEYISSDGRVITFNSIVEPMTPTSWPSTANLKQITLTDMVC